jgi:D-glycero-D-manno-heptose 1,7-bisphosphate phosphatase
MQSKPLRKGLFLDRDGIVNINQHYVHHIYNFEFVPGIFELCFWARSKGFAIVIVTNQSGIGRGLFTIDQYHKLTHWMLGQFLAQDCTIDLVVTSPIDPNDETNSEALKFRRKPNPGMIFDACEVLNIDPHISVLIGDSDSDIEAGMAAGIPALIKIGQEVTQRQGISNFPDLNAVLKKKELVIK